MRVPRPPLLLLSLLATLAAATAGAQGASEPSPAAPTHERRASLNLLGIPLGLVSAEYEQMNTSEVSTGASAGVDEDNAAWVEGKVRYYPNARGPRVFALGISAGVARVNSYTDGDCILFCSDASGPAGTGATVGVLLDYSWLIGRTDRFYIGTGVGAKRVLGLDDTEARDYPNVLPAGRLQVGYTF